MAVRRKNPVEEKTMKTETSENEMSQEKVKHKEEILNKLFVPYEAKIMYLQGLLVWETPQYSALLFTGVNILFWLSTYMRIYYLIGMTGFCVCSWSLWTHHVWPEIRVPSPFGQDSEDWTPVHPRLLSVPEICHHVAGVLVRVEMYGCAAYHMRKRKPAKFFVYAVTMLSLLALLGHYVRGITILYFTVMSVLLLPSMCYYDVMSQIQGHVQPLVEQMEDSMNIKRKRSAKRQKKSGEPSRVADLSDTDDEDLRLFVPDIAESQASQLSLKTRHLEDDEESMSFTPRLNTPHMPDMDISDNDSTLGDLPSQMPSVLHMDDSLTYDFRLTDSQDGTTNSSNSNNATAKSQLASWQDTEADVTSQDMDSTASQIDDESADSLHTDSTPKAEENPISTLSGDVMPTKDNSCEQSRTKTAQSSSKNLEFVSEHFKQSSGEDDEDDSKLELGLEFPDIEKELRSGDNGQGRDEQMTPAQQMGAMLAGALTGAQSSVTNMAATHMVASLMQNTVSNILGGGASAPTAGQSQSKDPKARVKLEGQGSRDSDAEFEFLSQEDFENFDQ